ncbi:hypothetical protein [Sutcliffiella horikoshii]|uniref:hypothetical protein n=1 Tax=Sutcliffiella horikoshii TaxID=79883 RepID=UPI001F16CFCD|nr:hypothetical protein [Sutcliffiella horikoshii]MCG1021453.1 hypothetical protein [Sutcliffiella horikoshii]
MRFNIINYTYTQFSTCPAVLTSIEYRYDDMGQVTGKVFKSKEGSNPETVRETTLVYDELGRLVKETGLADGLITENRHFYDENNNILKKWIYDQTVKIPSNFDPDGDGIFDSVTVYQYDNNNRLIKESISHTGTETINEFNDRNDSETFKNFLGDTVVYYDANERVKEITTPNFDSFNTSIK